MSEFIIEINQENAQQVIIEGSHNALVVVDFWADWCAPCKALMPILEKLAHEYQGQFILAKINADEQQMLTAQFGIRSLPTVMFVKNGQPVDGFAGAETESKIRAMLDKYLPKPWEADLEQARELQLADRHHEALSILRKAYNESSQQPHIALALAHSLIELNRLDEAEGLLSTIKMADQDQQFEQLQAQLALRKDSLTSPELKALESQYLQDESNLEVACQYAVQLGAESQEPKALEVLLGVLKKDLQFGEARKLYLDMIASLGKGDPVAIDYQKRFFTLLY